MGSLIYVLALKFEFVNISATGFDAAALQQDFMTKVPLTWLVCCLFSFSTFFLRGLWRKFFLLCPIIVPMIYGIILLQPYI